MEKISPLDKRATRCFSVKSTILDKSLSTLAHFFSICQRNLSVRPPPPNSMLFYIGMNLSLLASNIVGGGGGKGVPNSGDVTSYCLQNGVTEDLNSELPRNKSR